MKRWIAKGCYFYWCWLSVFLVVGNAAAAISPDPQVRAELQTLFSGSPQVRGYPYQELLATASARYDLPLPFARPLGSNLKIENNN